MRIFQTNVSCDYVIISKGCNNVPCNDYRSRHNGLSQLWNSQPSNSQAPTQRWSNAGPASNQRLVNALYFLEELQKRRRWRERLNISCAPVTCRHIVASELKDPICHSNECQIGSFSSEATICLMTTIYGDKATLYHAHALQHQSGLQLRHGVSAKIKRDLPVKTIQNEANICRPSLVIRVRRRYCQHLNITNLPALKRIAWYSEQTRPSFF